MTNSHSRHYPSGKKALLEEFISLMSTPAIVHHASYYSDERVRAFIHQKGPRLLFDKQNCGIFLSLDLVAAMTTETGWP